MMKIWAYKKISETKWSQNDGKKPSWHSEKKSIVKVKGNNWKKKEMKIIWNIIWNINDGKKTKLKLGEKNPFLK